jgi:murein DD-endopeptidase MepM/ murein hydrolase activator NlpD
VRLLNFQVWRLAFLVAGLAFFAPSASAATAAPSVAAAGKIGDSIADIREKYGEPQSSLEAGNRTIVNYPSGQIVFVNGRVTEIAAALPPPAAQAASVPPSVPPAAAAPAPAAGTFPPEANQAPPSPEYIKAHPGDVHLVTRNDAEGVVTILAESDYDTEFTITLNANLTNATPSKPLPVTVDSAGQKSVVVVQYTRTNPAQAWHYESTFFAQPGAQRAAKTNDAVYQLPFSPHETHVLAQGNFGAFSHYEGSGSEHAFDFTCEPGTIICAARAGVVTGVRQDYTQGGTDKAYGSMGNYIIIKHADGTFAEYFHIQHNGALVQLGQQVGAGQHIALSGATGHVTGPHLHFSVFQNITGQQRLSLPTRFEIDGQVLDNLKQGARY